MKEDYQPVFFSVVEETQTRTGYELPDDVAVYLVMLMCEYLDGYEIPPTPSFAHKFLSIQTAQQAKVMGDVCLITSGVFPNFKNRHGITRKYYQDMGTTSYDMASPINTELFSMLSQHFIFLSDFIELAVSSPRLIKTNIFYK